jgi:WD40 repeat protein
MWTKPTEENKFSTQGKCRIGHKSDIISIDCSQEFIASGGVDGKVVIWNIFSGQKKHTISMPAIKAKLNIKLKTEYKDSSCSELMSQASREGSRESNYPEAHQNIKDLSIGEQIKITVTELCFHPDNNNFVYALQESGDVHLIDCTNGVIT